MVLEMDALRYPSDTAMTSHVLIVEMTSQMQLYLLDFWYVLEMAAKDCQSYWPQKLKKILTPAPETKICIVLDSLDASPRSPILFGV